MENTRENLVKLLSAMIDSAHVLADQFKEEDPELANLKIRQAINYQEAFWLITDEKYFNDIWNIYFREEGEN